MTGLPVQAIPDRSAGAEGPLWPPVLYRAVAVMVTDTAAWVLGLVATGLVGLDWSRAAGFVLAAAMTQVAVGQATAGAIRRLRAVLLSLGVAIVVASGFAVAVNARFPSDLGACALVTVVAVPVSIGARGWAQLIRRHHPVPEPAHTCTFAETLDLHWLPQIEISAVRAAPQPQLAGADLSSRSVRAGSPAARVGLSARSRARHSRADLVHTGSN